MKYIKTTIKDFLNERLVDVNDDVDMLYKRFFEKDFEYVNNGGKIDNSELFKTHYIDTSELISPVAKKAHSLNPCKIIINKRDGNNFNHYNPSKSLIVLNVNLNAINFIRDCDDKTLESAHEELINMRNPEQARNILNDFQESSIKGSIHHELTHWIDDSLHNKHITKKMDIANERGKAIPNVYSEKFEIEASVHNVAQLKREYSDIWDTLSFDDMLILSPALSSTTRTFKGDKDVINKWKRFMKARMAREGLLGKNMR